MVTGILMSLVLFVTLYYAKNKLKVTAKKWDLDMITASDYTVTYVIDQKDYEFFKEQHEEEGGESASFAYMSVLKKRFEDLVSEQPHVIQETTDIRIANISYSFSNNKMIQLLTKRGSAIANHNLKEKLKIEKEIEDLRENNLDEISNPSMAFITFEIQEGYERAINVTSGLSYPFKPAVEPTNIIWENSHFSFTHIVTRSIIVISIIAFLLLGAFAIFFFLKKGLITTNAKYMNLNCDSFNKYLDNDDTRVRYALIDYYDFYHSGTKTMMTGALQCFCDQYYNQHGVLDTIGQEFSHPKVLANGKVFKEQICKEWGTDLLFSPFWSSLVSFITVFLNFFLREIIMYLIYQIGFHTETSQTNVIMIFVFLVQFFNTALLINLVNANTSEAFSSLGLFNGSYADFNFNWYSDIGGTIIYTMAFNAFWPFIEVAMNIGMSIFFRILDKGLSFSKYKTKSKTIQQYINLYSGPDYLIHFKYSRMLNIVFVTFMYGLALPWVFPIGLITLIIDYVIEKICIVYYYKDPPSYDNKLNDTAISLMKWAPLFMFSVGYWMFSNRQMFENHVVLSTEANPRVETTGHQVFHNLTSTPAFIFFIAT